MPLWRSGRVILPAACSAFHGFIQGRTPCSRSAMILLVILLYTSRNSVMSLSPSPLVCEAAPLLPDRLAKTGVASGKGVLRNRKRNKIDPLSWGQFCLSFRVASPLERARAAPLANETDSLSRPKG